MPEDSVVAAQMQEIKDLITQENSPVRFLAPGIRKLSGDALLAHPEVKNFLAVAEDILRLDENVPSAETTVQPGVTQSIGDRFIEQLKTGLVMEFGTNDTLFSRDENGKGHVQIAAKIDTSYVAEITENDETKNMRVPITKHRAMAHELLHFALDGLFGELEEKPDTRPLSSSKSKFDLNLHELNYVIGVEDKIMAQYGEPPRQYFAMTVPDKNRKKFVENGRSIYEPGQTWRDVTAVKELSAVNEEDLSIIFRHFLTLLNHDEVDRSMLKQEYDAFFELQKEIWDEQTVFEAMSYMAERVDMESFEDDAGITAEERAELLEYLKAHIKDAEVEIIQKGKHTGKAEITMPVPGSPEGYTRTIKI